MGSDDGDGSFNHLPGAPRRFFNRVPELGGIAATAAAARAAEQTGLVCLTGMAGMGKTTLALRAAYEHLATFADVQLYADLRGSSPEGPADPVDLLGSLLRQLGDAEEELPVGLDDRAKHFRARTWKRRCLMFLDDAYSAAQVQALLPSSPTALVIVTSRRWFDGLDVAGFDEIKVGRFTDEVSAQLLRDSIGPAVLGSEADAVRDLIAVCGGTPLALKVASARINRWRRPEPVSGFVATLRSQQALDQLHLDGTSMLEPIYDLCYAELTPAQAEAYCLLALHPGPDFGLGAAAAMLGVAPEPAAEVLAELRELELLDGAGPGRYRFHHLIGVHARGCAFRDADEDRRGSAIGAAVVYYLEFLIGRIKSISQRKVEGSRVARIPATYTGADAGRRAVADLEREYQSLRAAVEAAYKLGMDTECLELCEALRGWFYDTDRTSQLAEILEFGVLAAQRLGNALWQMQMLRHVAVAYEKQGSQLDAAGFKHGREALKQARQIAEELGRPLEVATTFEWEGLLYEARGQRDEALQELRVAYGLAQAAVAEPAERRRVIALLDMHLGRVLVGLGDRDAGVEHLHRALAEFADRAEERVNVARLRHLLGADSLAGDRLDEARAHLDAAAAAFHDGGFASQELAVQRLRAETAARLGDTGGVRSALREALALAQRLGRDRAADEISRQIGDLG